MKKKIISVILIVGFAACIGFLYVVDLPDGLLHFYALDIGQGDALLIRTPGGKNILVDGGPGDAVLNELEDVLPFFNRDIDAIFLTNPDKDHMEGLIYAMKNYPVRRVFFTGANKKSFLYSSFLKAIHDKQIPITITDSTSDLHFDDGVTIDVLFPFTQMINSHVKTNNASIVAKVTYGESSIMLTGDAEIDEEEKLIAAARKNEFDLTADVLKAGHHGSDTSSSQNFINAISPQVAVISCGKNNKYGHPKPSVLERLKADKIPTYRTDTMGRVEFIFSKKGIEKILTKNKKY